MKPHHFEICNLRIERRRPRGVTLLELLLAIALSAIILFAIGIAIDLHLRVLDVKRTNLEESQLARALLRRMADDLRGAVRYEEPDLSGVTGFAEDLAGDALGDEADLGGLLPGLGLDDIGSTEEESQDAVGIAAATAPPSVPGLYGNQFELQVDVSRLPREDEYNALAAELGGGVPSDLKTVAYYLQLSEAAGAPAGAMMSPGAAPQGGLVRRQMDRAVAQYQAASGFGGAAPVGDVLAPEVVGLEYRYFDGAAWLTEWDSVAMGGLPLAVEINLAIARRGYEGTESFVPSAPVGGIIGDDQGISYYRLVVKLPMGGPSNIVAAEEAAAEEEPTEDGATEGTTPATPSGGTSGGGTGTTGGGAPSTPGGFGGAP